jgi:hypothetical protein
MREINEKQFFSSKLQEIDNNYLESTDKLKIKNKERFAVFKK